MDSTLSGVIRAVVSEDVHSFDGTRVLISRGGQLIGRYRSEVSLAQSRVMVGWDRIILPDDQITRISAFGGGELGRSGVTGAVDTRFGTRLGSAALISLIGAVPTAAAARIDDDTTSDAASDVATDLRDTSRGVMRRTISRSARWSVFRRAPASPSWSTAIWRRSSGGGKFPRSLAGTIGGGDPQSQCHRDLHRSRWPGLGRVPG